MNQSTSNFFFYGALMDPDLVRGVAKTNGIHLEIAPAILKKHTRHQVKGEPHPAVISYIKAKELMDRELEEHERSVRGVVVKNFTKMDTMYLDFFEGLSFESRKVSVYPLGPFKPLPAFPKRELLSPDLILSEEHPEPVAANCYMWRGPVSWLTPEILSFEDFLAQRLQKCVASPPDATEDRASEPDPQVQEDTPAT